MLSRIIQTLFISIAATSFVYAADTTTDTAKKTGKDNEIIGVLIALNNNEIAIGKIALQKTNTTNVKDYANMMVEDHTNNLTETMAISDKINEKPMASAKETELKEQGKKEEMKLADVKPDQFDKTYMQSMVKEHTDALKLVDNQIKNANNEDLKNHLMATRDKIAAHLENAKKITNSMQ